jgi:hypothetical protein|tara:strand:- start:112 stop:984 length:873 start_codon:yes stop_codon:yes gene_type:complete
MDFIQELQEARMTRNADNQRRLTYNDCKERSFLILLMIYAMRYYKNHRGVVGAYTYKTVMYREYTRFRIDGTDLYNMFYFITGDDAAINKLKDPESAKVERSKTLISVGKLNGFLRSTADSKLLDSNDYLALTTLEKELSIKNPDYKSIRRRLSTFSTDTQEERKTTITRLLFAARAKLSDSDFLLQFTRLTLDKDLEDFTKTSPELDLSIPDNITQADVVNYRFLVPVERLPFVAKFLSTAQQGRAVIAQFVQAYLPIIIMIDDIVQAGPAYIAQLKQLHNRAKRDLKK